MPLYDNSAFAAQEAMAYGRMVLCSDKGGTGICRKQRIDLDPLSNQSIIDMVEQFKKWIVKLGQSAREFSLNNFSKYSYANHYLKIVNNALS